VFSLSHGESRVRLEARAPVENSWLSVEICILDDSGLTVSRQYLNLSYYHGTIEGRPWATGRQKAAELLDLAPGDYRLLVSGEAGGGTSKSADFVTFGRPVTITVRAGAGAFRSLLWISCITSLMTAAWVLYHLSRMGRSFEVGTSARKPPGRPERFVMVDGLRGMAALAVVLCHLTVPEICRFSAGLKSSLPQPLPSLLRHGDLGVEVFFVLSGFVIAYSVRGRTVNAAFAGRFALRRAIRLDPPYYLTILISLTFWAYFLPFGLSQVLDDVGGPRGLVANMFYLQDLLGFVSPISIAWTLCLEVQFYLAFIGLLSLAQAVGGRFRRVAAGERVVGEASAGALLLVFVPVLAVSLGLWYPGLRRFDFLGTWFRFFLGVTVYWVFSGQLSGRWLAVFALVLSSLGIATWDARGLTALATGLLITEAGRAGGLTSWLSSRWIQFLGRISYSLYLIHIPLGMGAANLVWSHTDRSDTGALLCAAIAVLVSLTAAWGVHIAFESPSIILSKRIVLAN
jgi:peptidoglycan/LPS O-acetylase OafA/YrhL